jgi:hypothetical protein
MRVADVAPTKLGPIIEPLTINILAPTEQKNISSLYLELTLISGPTILADTKQVS